VVGGEAKIARQKPDTIANECIIKENMAPQAALFKTFDLNLGKFTFSPTYWMAVAVVVLIFLLIITLAFVRRHYLEWSFKGTWVGLFIGIALTLILEGFLLLSGRTALTVFLGWKNPPKAIQNVLDSGRSKLISVLGVSSQIPASDASEKVDEKKIIEMYQSLTPQETKHLKLLICKP